MSDDDSRMKTGQRELYVCTAVHVFVYSCGLMFVFSDVLCCSCNVQTMTRAVMAAMVVVGMNLRGEDIEKAAKQTKAYGTGLGKPGDTSTLVVLNTQTNITALIMMSCADHHADCAMLMMLQ